MFSWRSRAQAEMSRNRRSPELLAAARLTRRLHQRNRPASSRTNVEHHYDLDSGLYEMFLDSDRQYSCAYFETNDATWRRANSPRSGILLQNFG